jgi:S-DNA-T family DNA segregation ATPase FtsK/SpoIIIE
VTRRLVPSGLPAVWDALVDVLDPAASPAEPSERSSCLLLIDDVDALVSSCPEDYEAALLDLLSRALREGPSRGIHFALTAQRIPGPLQSVAALCGSRVVLAMPSRQEHVLAGGDGAEFSPGLRQGAAHWAGHRIQVLLAEAPLVGVEDAVAIPQRTRRIDLASGSPLAVVSTRPERFASTLRELLPGRPVTVLGARPPIADERAILVGDPETWQAQWGVLGTLRGTAELLFDGCSLLDFRTLTRSRELPPPSPRGERPLWLLGADGRLSRARLASRTGRPPPGIRHPSSRAER